MQHEIYTLLMAIVLRKFKHAQEQSQLDGISYATLEEAWDYANDIMEDGYAHIARQIRHEKHHQQEKHHQLRPGAKTTIEMTQIGPEEKKEAEEDFQRSKTDEAHSPDAAAGRVEPSPVPDKRPEPAKIFSLTSVKVAKNLDLYPELEASFSSVPGASPTSRNATLFPDTLAKTFIDVLPDGRKSVLHRPNTKSVNVFLIFWREIQKLLSMPTHQREEATGGCCEKTHCCKTRSRYRRHIFLQDALNVLHVLRVSFLDVRQYICSSLHPHFAKSRHIAEMLVRIENQLNQITDQARYHMEELELKYPDGAKKAKQVMLSRECLSVCISEVHNLHMMGLFDDHAHGELQQYLETELTQITNLAIGPNLWGQCCSI